MIIERHNSIVQKLKDGQSLTSHEKKILEYAKEYKVDKNHPDYAVIVALGVNRKNRPDGVLKGLTYVGSGVMAHGFMQEVSVVVVSQLDRLGDTINKLKTKVVDTTKRHLFRVETNLGKGAGSTYSNLAKQATKNANSTEVVLGKFNQGGVSYTKVAQKREATYFQLDNWDDVVKNVGEKNIWNINESFIRQQASANKAFILSHDPAQATGYFANEVNLLKDMGYSFIKEGTVWRAIK